MRIEPVKRYRAPKYATYEYLLEHPELLEKVPERWRGNKLVIAAACAFAMITTNIGCGDPSIFGGPPRPGPFITEEDARTIIRDEAARSGLTFISDSLTIDSVRIPLHLWSGSNATDTVRYSPAIHFTFDGHDTLHHITYEFISRGEFYQWQNLDTTMRNASFDVLKTARDIQNQLRNQHPELHSGVFYDPGLEAELRQQVQDFIAWLRSEGIM